MKVKELIEILSKEDPNHDVMISSGSFGHLDLVQEDIWLGNLVRNSFGNMSEVFYLQPEDLGNAIVIG